MPTTVKGLVLGLVFLVVSAAIIIAEPADDYLSPELRARVERLKVEAPQRTDDRGRIRERMDTLWEWANALAFERSAPLPRDFPLLFAVGSQSLLGADDPVTPGQVAMLSDERGAVRPEYVADFVARYARELTLKELHPNAVGRLALSDPGPFVVGATVTLTQTWTAGDVPMTEGGGVVLASGATVTNTAGAPLLQADDPSKPNYVTVACPKPGVRLEKVDPWGRWQTFLTVPAACYRLVDGGPLVSGDTIVVTYRGLQMGHGSVDALTLPVYLDLEASGHILTPSLPTYGVIGAPETRYVNAVAPSIVTPHERFELAVRSEDRFKNPVSGLTPVYHVTLDGRTVATLPASKDPVTVVRDLELTTPGVFRFEVRSLDGRLRGRSNPVWVLQDPDHRIYWGDTHTHTGLADGMGTPDALYRFARDFARLDFFTYSEHDVWTDEYEWQLMQQKNGEYVAPGSFTPILGYEWTAMVSRGGHNNVYFRTGQGRVPITNRTAVGKHELYIGLRELYDPRDVVIIPHAHAPGDWRLNDPVMERLVEIQSGHGTFEWYGNRFLEQGWKVGFVGSSDNHATHGGYSPGTSLQIGGLAAVLAPENTEQGIFDALRGRACYATTGERIILDVSLGGETMGGTVRDDGERRLRCRAMGTEPIEAIDLIKNGEVVFTRRYLEARVQPTTRVKIAYESPRGDAVGPFGSSGRRPQDWRSIIEVRNARLAGFAEPWYANPATFQVRREPSSSNGLVFDVTTAGREQALSLDLEEAGPATEIVIRSERLDSQLVFRLGELEAGPKESRIQIGTTEDIVRVEVIPDDGALDQELVFMDTDKPAVGDYYYVRVRQVDGSMAWSSPIWVGVD